LVDRVLSVAPAPRFVRVLTRRVETAEGGSSAGRTQARALVDSEGGAGLVVKGGSVPQMVPQVVPQVAWLWAVGGGLWARSANPLHLELSERQPLWGHRNTVFTTSDVRIRGSRSSSRLAGGMKHAGRRTMKYSMETADSEALDWR